MVWLENTKMSTSQICCMCFAWLCHFSVTKRGRPPHNPHEGFSRLFGNSDFLFFMLPDFTNLKVGNRIAPLKISCWVGLLENRIFKRGVRLQLHDIRAPGARIWKMETQEIPRHPLAKAYGCGSRMPISFWWSFASKVGVWRSAVCCVRRPAPCNLAPAANP